MIRHHHVAKQLLESYPVNPVIAEVTTLSYRITKTYLILWISNCYNEIPVIKKLPNWLTFFRLALIPLFVFLLTDPTPRMITGAAIIFAIAAITDYVDGFIARRFSATSDFGKLLDPLADKILVMSALVMLLAQRTNAYGEPWVPAWMVVLVLAREIWVTGLRAVAASRGLIVAAGNAGKVKSGLQMVAIILLILHERPLSYLAIPLGWTCQFVGTSLLFLSIAFSLWSAFEYTWAILIANKKET
jgi:CDP-diacylglycerol--glycerol-3-phosphate 3-phosphatidyltransferase